jgi:hypothetical protein
MAIKTTALINQAVADAKDLPQLVEFLQTASPPLAAALETKPLAYSKTPWGTLAVAVVAWVSSKYGLGLDANTCALIGGFGALVGAYAMRAITTGAISGVVTTPPDTTATSTTPTPSVTPKA